MKIDSRTISDYVIPWELDRHSNPWNVQEYLEARIYGTSGRDLQDLVKQCRLRSSYS